MGRNPHSDQEWIHDVKSTFVHEMRDLSSAAGAMFDLPPELVAGVMYNEFGGKDVLEPLVYAGRGAC